MGKTNKHKTKDSIANGKNEARDHSVGEMLKRERTKRDISLDEIAKETKIAKMFLIAIENDDMKALPGGIYTRNFLRAYSGFLGVDEDIITSQFNEQFNIKPQSIVQHERTKYDDRQFKRLKRRSLRIIGLIVIVLLALGYVTWKYSPMFRAAAVVPQPQLNDKQLGSSNVGALNDNPSTTMKPDQKPQTMQDKTSVLDSQEAERVLLDELEPISAPSALSLPLQSLEGVEIANASSAALESTFAVEAIEDVWFEVYIDGQEFTRRMLLAGELRVYKYGQSNRVKLGDISHFRFQDGVEFLGQVSSRKAYVGFVNFQPGTLAQSLASSLVRKDVVDGVNPRSN